ncbi:MAG: sigma-54-dependent transcriptional regulator [Syntrophobacteraceae bacterium]
MFKIIAVDDEQDFLDSIRRGLFTAGYRNIRLESDSARACEIFRSGESCDLALLDITMPGVNGIELLRTIKECSPNTECIMISASNEAKLAVASIKEGAYDYIVKPVSREDLLLKVGHALEKRRLMGIVELAKKNPLPELQNPGAFSPLVTASRKMMHVLKEAELHAMSDVPVLITGESGTGKELLARAIHLASPRASLPYTAVNMASVCPNFIDSEFFGHTRGAFTGAEKEKAGYLELTHRGSLFLDEIGTLPLDLQGKLLRVIQEGEFRKVGAPGVSRVDIRFISATNEDMEKLTAKELFRKDLYYRLKGAWLHLPPLRERKEDIPLLISKFLEEQSPDRTGPGIEDNAVSILMAYDFPGNIRELQSIVRAARNLAMGGPIKVRNLPSHLRERRGMQKSHPPCDFRPEATLVEVEKAHILKTYEKTGRNKAKTAKLLGAGLNTIRRKLESYGEN